MIQINPVNLNNPDNSINPNNPDNFNKFQQGVDIQGLDKAYTRA